MAGDQENTDRKVAASFESEQGMLGTPPVSAILGPLDDAPLQKFHLSTVVLSAFGWIQSGWEYVLMTHIIYMLSYIKYPTHKDGMPQLYLDVLRVSLFAGTLVGQLFWGFMGDMYGRKRMFLVENFFTTAALLLTAVGTWGPGDVVVWVWVLFRFMVGFGIGGEYSLPAVLTAEFSCKRWRGAMVGTVFASQCIGHVMSCVVSIVVIRAFKEPIHQCTLGVACRALDNVWRVILAISCVPAIVIFFVSNLLPESPRWTLFTTMNALNAHRDVYTTLAMPLDSVSSRSQQPNPAKTQEEQEQTLLDYLREPGVAKKLFACSVSWFLKDINFGTIMLWGGVFLNDAFDKYVQVLPGEQSGHTIYEFWMHMWQGFTLFYLVTNVIGFTVGVSLIDVFGRKTMQMAGFFLSAVFLGAAAVFHDADPKVFAVLLIMALLLANTGPNLTVYVVPSELFKTKFRCRCFGIAAATGRCGTIISLLAMDRMMKANPHGTLGLLSAFALLGIMTTLLLPEGKGRSLEELSGDDWGQEAPSTNVPISTGNADVTASVKVA